MLVSLTTKGLYSVTLHANLDIEKEKGEFFVVARTPGENGGRQTKETHHTNFAEAARSYKAACKQIDEFFTYHDDDPQHFVEEGSDNAT